MQGQVTSLPCEACACLYLTCETGKESVGRRSPKFNSAMRTVCKWLQSFAKLQELKFGCLTWLAPGSQAVVCSVGAMRRKSISAAAQTCFLNCSVLRMRTNTHCTITTAHQTRQTSQCWSTPRLPSSNILRITSAANPRLERGWCLDGCSREGGAGAKLGA